MATYIIHTTLTKSNFTNIAKFSNPPPGHQVNNIAAPLLRLEEILDYLRGDMDDCREFTQGAGRIKEHDNQSRGKGDRILQVL